MAGVKVFALANNPIHYCKYCGQFDAQIISILDFFLSRQLLTSSFYETLELLVKLAVKVFLQFRQNFHLQNDFGC